MICAIVFYGLLILFVGFVSVEPLTQISAMLMSPAEWGVYSWAPMHATWAFVLANAVNLIFYFSLFAIIFRLFVRPSAVAHATSEMR